MAVGITVDFYWYQIGTGDFFHSFFSTIAFNLEGGSWGSRFPVFMKDFYDGKMLIGLFHIYVFLMSL